MKIRGKTMMVFLTLALIGGEAFARPKGTEVKTKRTTKVIEKPQGNGGTDRNGGEDTKKAYDPREVENLTLEFGLDYLKLTPEEISARRNKLAPVLGQLYNTKITQALNLIESTYGLHVFHHMRYIKEPTLNSPEGIMDNLVRYYMGIEGEFSTASEVAIPYKGKLVEDAKRVSVRSIKKSGHRDFDETSTLNTNFLFTTELTTWGKDHLFGFVRTDVEALYTTIENRLFEAPVLDNFIVAIDRTNLRALDATLVFLSYDLMKLAGQDLYGRRNYEKMAYEVVYPPMTRTAPIHQPVIFISVNASVDDIEELLVNHAPQIYAYNKLFELKLLPQYTEIVKMLEKFPDILEIVETAAAEVAARSRSLENKEDKIYDAFLKVIYGVLKVGLAPIGLGDLLGDDELREIFKEQLRENIGY